MLLSTGTNGDIFAGFRACVCLEGYYRTHMFQKCHKCGLGLECHHEHASLKPGYWWSWRNKNHKERYRAFIRNILAYTPALGTDDVQYPYPLPIPYRCPEETSCKVGIDSSCEGGYTGPLCSVCQKGYLKQLHQCTKCPSKAWIGGQLLIITVVLLIITAVCV